jgi:hypothetical protein
MDSEITSAALQRLLGINKSVLSDLVARKIVKPGRKRGSYMRGASVSGYCQHLREQASGRAETLPMTDADLHLEARDRDIVVTLPGADYAVTYYKATRFPQQLLAKSYSGREVERAPMTRVEFFARAWRLANDKARELGWIV